VESEGGLKVKKTKASKMKRYAIEIEREDGMREIIATVDARNAPEAHRLYVKLLELEKKKGKP
jgi:hypothetical protein